MTECLDHRKTGQNSNQRLQSGWEEWARNQNLGAAGFEVRDHIGWVSVRWEDGIEDVFNDAGKANESRASEQAHGSDCESGQGKSVSEGESLIAEQVEGQMKPIVNLALVISGLRAEPEDLGAKPTNFCVIVAEGTRLGRAATRTGNLVPAGRKWNAGTTGHRICVKHNQSRPLAGLDVGA